jgi:dolichyl-phosphate beta-glucosyltransferase
MDRPYLSVVIPAYREAERIPKTLIDLDRKLQTKEWTYEILVINDGSPDNTAEVVRKMAPTIKNLRLIDNEKNQGKGGVVRQGMLAAEGEIRLFMDADNATTIDHFDQMIPYFKEGYGVVICSRAIKGSVMNPPEPWYRQIPGKLGNLFWIQLLILPGLWDTQCGFKAFKAEVAEKVFSLSKISGWSFDVEILALAKKLKYRIKEVPVSWHHDGKSTLKMSAYIFFLLEVLKIRLWLLFGSYDLNKYRN